MKTLALLTLAPPLLGGIILAVAGRDLPRRTCETLACLAVLASFAASAAAWFLFPGGREVVHLAPWFQAGAVTASIDVLYDPLSLIMAMMVTGVSSIIHVHAVHYMREDEGYVRFFCHLNLFVFSMLAITLADNLLFLFLGWEGVGYCSFALIGHWNQETFRGLAGQKAFLYTRVGDVAFVAAMAVLVANVGSLSIDAVDARAAELSPALATTLGLLFLFAATGKSAQLPLLVWLPDAMAGPTPVSALIHAATMVTAGVYLLMRLFPLAAASPDVLLAMACVGALTAFMGCLAALGQRDIKRVLAWSTISQVGYMLLALGAGDVTGSMFHLLAHAFFKALLFLAAGCVIQILHEEQDLLNMGAMLRRASPEVFRLFAVGAACLAALPPTSGYFSKGRILEAVLGQNGPVYGWLFVLAGLGALITAFYTFRMLFLAFWGKPLTPMHHEPATLPRPMTAVLWPLAVLALGAGVGGGPLAHALQGVPGVAPLPHTGYAFWVEAGDAAAGIMGLVMAWLLYAPARRPSPRALAAREDGVFGVFRGGLGLDAFYNACFAAPYRALSGALWKGVDRGLVDGALAGLAGLFAWGSERARPLATGRLSLYLSLLAAGLALLLGFLAAWAR
ncbi:NADH-quinone oxidoreductase subunit L [Fundidesulfovibrio magnetotacticus]|uniref:NADH-quinone oxidoreductase subunit L n=1 Tax=Fundidesulfovibrio magnetotacticus TaxID=2730080 RepID=A0A6V8LL80_9BACT|nr:NADH-quinone oxidoreductase subunit L [Fundidesulfovibrio magnetotacticus]GFK92454.1 NADH-quinone oxidoreductase subunit L [Fundidesulfovibrio magnetotacticus]